ncbi:DUF2931 family protein [Marinobacter pelagius]|uniref:DUF2931 family protein n=1 Tax=Marinobacter sp. C7 TaxID=2951363 RepID=UPI001EF01701|nr:DUF2931 family protein [Marinobacter sp. C7]MCG7200149.1 DUF2931 family protein [Marinobacter sp. C7]
MRIKKVLIIIISLTLSSCASTTRENENITWRFQLATPKHYDIWVEHLEFELSGVRHWWHPAGSMGCCWKGPNGPRGVSGRMEPFPNFVAIQWFSFAEQRFYQRLIEVPPVWKERMQALAPMVTQVDVRMKPRDTLTFGLAPGGEIVVWMMNQPGNEIELARLQANEIEGNPSHYQNRTREYLEENGEYLEEHGIPLTGW